MIPTQWVTVRLRHWIAKTGQKRRHPKDFDATNETFVIKRSRNNTHNTRCEVINDIQQDRRQEVTGKHICILIEFA